MRQCEASSPFSANNRNHAAVSETLQLFRPARQTAAFRCISHTQPSLRFTGTCRRSAEWEGFENENFFFHSIFLLFPRFAFAPTPFYFGLLLFFASLGAASFCIADTRCDMWSFLLRSKMPIRERERERVRVEKDYLPSRY